MSGGCTPARLLVVDDEPGIADLLRELLESAGYAVHTAGSGAEALRLLERSPYDGVVSDLRMPDVDGAALWRSVAQRWPALAQRVLFVTGDTLSPAAERFVADTGCASLDKPFSRRELLQRVQALVATNETRCACCAKPD